MTEKNLIKAYTAATSENRIDIIMMLGSKHNF